MADFGGGRRRWTFADCVFDEANWTLAVGGQRVPIESKPLAILRELLVRCGNLVTKDELLDAIWPDVVVVEASLPTAIHKLRLALNDEHRDPQLIETVPRRGYRLVGPVQLDPPAQAAEAGRPAKPRTRPYAQLALVGALAAAVVAVGFAFVPLDHHASARAVHKFSEAEVKDMLRRLDVAKAERMIEAGWNPDALLGSEGNNSINYVVEMCEWNRGQNRQQMIVMIRTLVENGAQFERHNVWGDTAYSIAKAPRFCGPDDPVTKSLWAMCHSGRPEDDHCEADYAHARANRKA